MRQTMIKKFGSEEAWKKEMKRLGALGGRNGNTGGFGHPVIGQELARRAGAIGGRISRRTKRDNN